MSEKKRRKQDRKIVASWWNIHSVRLHKRDYSIIINKVMLCCSVLCKNVSVLSVMSAGVSCASGAASIERDRDTPRSQ